MYHFGQHDMLICTSLHDVLCRISYFKLLRLTALMLLPSLEIES